MANERLYSSSLNADGLVLHILHLAHIWGWSRRSSSASALPKGSRASDYMLGALPHPNSPPNRLTLPLQLPMRMPAPILHQLLHLLYREVCPSPPTFNEE